MQHDDDTEPKGLVVNPNTLRAGAAKPRKLRVKAKVFIPEYPLEYRGHYGPRGHD